MPLAAQADFEGCGCLLPLLGVAGALILGLRGAAVDRRHLLGLMVVFVTGKDRSRESISRMRSLLENRFAYDNEYLGVIDAIAFLVPEGNLPAANEARLVEVFRDFLRAQKITVPDTPQDGQGIWPPPPKFSVFDENDINEK